MFTARLGSVRSDSGAGFELELIAVVLLAGVSIFGGRGSIVGLLLAIGVFTLLQNGLSLADVSSDAQQIIVGVLLILSVLLSNAGLTLQPHPWLRRLRRTWNTPAPPLARERGDTSEVTDSNSDPVPSREATTT